MAIGTSTLCGAPVGEWYHSRCGDLGWLSEQERVSYVDYPIEGSSQMTDGGRVQTRGAVTQSRLPSESRVGRG